MARAAQVLANRSNARESTGPRMVRGKAVVAEDLSNARVAEGPVAGVSSLKSEASSGDPVFAASDSTLPTSSEPSEGGTPNESRQTNPMCAGSHAGGPPDGPADRKSPCQTNPMCVESRVGGIPNGPKARKSLCQTNPICAGSHVGGTPDGPAVRKLSRQTNPMCVGSYAGGIPSGSEARKSLCQTNPICAASHVGGIPNGPEVRKPSCQTNPICAGSNRGQVACGTEVRHDLAQGEVGETKPICYRIGVRKDDAQEYSMRCRTGRRRQAFGRILQGERVTWRQCAQLKLCNGRNYGKTC